VEEKMSIVISKSQFKPRALKYFRQVEQSGEKLIITDYSRPVVKIVPYHEDPQDTLKELRGSLVHYHAPCEPVAEGDKSNDL
jgi:antitoxin (DNA-binding transcriptional repressor) of toxin-antitoxin stability system